jgi:hypothetical protein
LTYEGGNVKRLEKPLYLSPEKIKMTAKDNEIGGTSGARRREEKFI